MALEYVLRRFPILDVLAEDLTQLPEEMLDNVEARSSKVKNVST